MGVNHSYEECKKPVNKSKNRYANIVACKYIQHSSLQLILEKHFDFFLVILKIIDNL